MNNTIQYKPMIELQKNHITFLVTLTNQMIKFFEKMKLFYQEQEIKRKKVFQNYKYQISMIISNKQKNQSNIQTHDQHNDYKKKIKREKKKQIKSKISQKLKLKKPKAPNSAYFMFFLDWKQQIKQDFPDQSMIDQAKMAGKLWKQLQQTQRQIYQQKYQQQKKKYDEQLRKYKQQKKRLEQEQQKQLQKNSQSQDDNIVEEKQVQGKQQLKVTKQDKIIIVEQKQNINIQNITKQSQNVASLIIEPIKLPVSFNEILQQQDSPISKIKQIELSLSLSDIEFQDKKQNNNKKDDLQQQDFMKKTQQLLQRLRRQSQFYEITQKYSNLVNKKLNITQIKLVQNNKLTKQINQNNYIQQKGNPQEDSLGQDSLGQDSI